MPIYQVGEHEILKEEADYVYGENESHDGFLYLSDKRLIFEKKGRRGLLKASPPQVIVDVYLHQISNISSAVPKIRAFTKKTLTVEYKNGDDLVKTRFHLQDPIRWETEIRRWIADSKRIEEERLKREEDEKYRKNVEMARAKAGTTNVGVAYYGKPNQGKQGDSKSSETIIDGESSSSIEVAKQGQVAKSSESNCKSCGEPLKHGMRFCPHCGEPVS